MGSFTTIPRNIPDFDSPSRQAEDAQWPSSGRSRYGPTASSSSSSYTNGLANNISISPFPFPISTDYSSRQLPMYKDKPYGHGANRSHGLRRSWRFWGIILFFGAGLFFWWTRGAAQARTSVFRGGSNELRHSGTRKGSGIWWKRREEVVKAMEYSWAGYEKYAWGFDEYHPESKSGRQMVPPTGLGWIIVDALDTLMLMNLTSQLGQARDWIKTTLHYKLDHDVNTFETTIRMLGGFLSAHYLQSEYPDLCPLPKGDKDAEDLYLEKAVELAERLMGAYDSPTGIPYASINLKTMQGIRSHADGGSSSLSEATTVQLEMKYLANLTGEAGYWVKAEQVMEAVDDPAANPEPDGLKGVFINPETGKYTSSYVRLGSRGDSYYEYLIKQYLQTSNQEPVYLEMWNEALEGIKKHLITYSSPSKFTVLAERPSGVRGRIEPKMDHLVCFFPGTLALAVTNGKTVQELKQSKKWTDQMQEDFELAEELTKTCWSTYRFTRTGLAGEITFFHLPTEEEQSMFYDFASVKDTSSKKLARPKGPDVMKDLADDADWRQDMMVKPSDAHNLQRPETVESLFVMWRLTGDEKYREWGWQMFESFVKHTKALDDGGYTSIADVNKIPAPRRDNMESFWLAETLKYFYLLFSPNDLLPLDKVVFNTEAHPFPKFQMGGLLKTGWKRKDRNDKGGLRLHEVEHGKRDVVEEPEVRIETVTVTKPKVAVATAKPAEGEVPMMDQNRDES